MKKVVFVLSVLALTVSANAGLTQFNVDSKLADRTAPVNTGIYINAGETWHLFATDGAIDKWVINPLYPSDDRGQTNADGTTYYTPPIAYHGLTANYGTLAGEVAGVAFKIGLNTTKTFTDSGFLFVSCWDSYNGDNDGGIDLSMDGPIQTPSVPAPGALLIAGLGTGLVGWMRRRLA